MIGACPNTIANTKPTNSACSARSYDGVPGHPVLLGCEHWAGVSASATGDRGARAYLAEHPPALVEVGDVARPDDLDVRPGA